MTKPLVMRVFFAVDLPSAVKETIGHLMMTFKKKSKSHAIRWTKPENLHITLQFLAEVKTEHVAQLVANVREKVAGQIKKSTFQFGVPQLFPTPYRPRVIVLDVTPQAHLAALSQLIGLGIKAAGYEIENRPYRAHVTLGRLKHVNGIPLGFLFDCPLPTLDGIPLDEIVLFQSEPKPDGSTYTPLERLKLF